MKFQLYYPIKPYFRNENNRWGKLDPANYSQFGFTRHNGEDDAIGVDGFVRAPFNGTIVQNGFQPNGGGIYCGFISDDEFDFDAFSCLTPDVVNIEFPAMKARVLLDFLHLKEIKAVEGQHYNIGDILAIADNTGFSTGPHTHIQSRRVSWDGKTITTLDTNDAHNSFDLTAFWTGEYAENYQFQQIQNQAVAAVSQAVEAVKQDTTSTPAQKAVWYQFLLDFLNWVKGR